MFLCSKLNIKVTGEGSDLSKKSVKFADGICPGEGTSPSGGEELSSPPPPRLPKEKRYKKTRALKKKSKKKKVKVNLLRYSIKSLMVILLLGSKTEKKIGVCVFFLR